MQVVVDNVNKAKKALDGAGLFYTEGTLEQVELPNKPGALAELAGSQERHQHRFRLCHDAQRSEEGCRGACHLRGSKDR